MNASRADAAERVPDQRGKRSKRIVYADALRALAILAVFAHHTFQQTAFSVHGSRWAFEWLGDWGVDCFFVLTGFLLTGPYFKAILGRAPMPSARLFAARRFLRIYPLYLFVLALSIIDVSIAGHTPTVGDIVAHLTMTHGFFTAFATQINGPLWTMAVDAQFYVLLPIVAAALATALQHRSTEERPRDLWIFLAMVVIGSLGIRCAALAFVALKSHITFDSIAVYARNVVGMASQFAIGSAVAYLGVLEATPRRSRAWYLGSVALGMSFLVVQATVSSAHLHGALSVLLKDGLIDVIGGCSAGLLIYGFTRGEFTRVTRMLALPVVETLAVLAYAIYLFHDPILSFVVALYHGPLGGIRITLGLGAVALFVSVLVAFVSHYGLERPFLAMRDRRREAVPTLP